MMMPSEIPAITGQWPMTIGSGWQPVTHGEHGWKRYVGDLWGFSPTNKGAGP
jgi:hypothetical protein